MTKRLWVVKYVAGNPSMFSRVRTLEPKIKSVALKNYGALPEDWRKWVEHVHTGEAIAMSDPEKHVRDQRAGRVHIEGGGEE